MNKDLTREILRLAYGFNPEITEQYLDRAKSRMEALIFSAPT